MHLLEHINTQHSILDILIKSNLLNVIILAVAFVYLGNKFLPKIIDQRRKQISKELEEAKLAKDNASRELENMRENTKRVGLEVAKIKEEAKKAADVIKKQIEQGTEKELEMLKQRIKREIMSSQEEAIQGIRKSTSEAAVKLAEEALGKVLQNEEVQKKLIGDFLAELKTPRS